MKLSCLNQPSSALVRIHHCLSLAVLVALWIPTNILFINVKSQNVQMYFLLKEINQYDFFFREEVISREQASFYEDDEVTYRHKYYPLPFGKMVPTVFGLVRLKKRKSVSFEIHGGLTIQREFKMLNIIIWNRTVQPAKKRG